MKIALLTMGTRGDVQPFAVLGQELQRRGHEVTLSTAENFESLVRSYGISFIPVNANYEALLNSSEGKKLLKANPFAIKRNLEKWIYPLVQQSLTDFYNLSKNSDRIVYHAKTMADCFADQFPGRMIRAMVVPAIHPTKSFPNPAFSGLRIPSFLNKFSYNLTNLAYRLMRKPIVRFRKSIGVPIRFPANQSPVIYGISPFFLERPKDYPANSFFTGFWLETSNEQLPTDLMAFIEAGEKPLLLTFGSMPFESKMDLPTALSKLSNELRTRIIVVKGWGIDDNTDFSGNRNIKVISSAPFGKLLPLVKAAVHHGGAGTTFECIRAGIPFWICPILYPVGDQQFWGKLAYQKKIAVKPVPLKKMTESLFVTKVGELLSSQELYVNSKILADKISLEDGIENAIIEIEKNSS